MIEEAQDEYVNVAQGCYAEITADTPPRIRGLVTFGMGTCTHVIVTNRENGYVSLCHADSSTNLKNEQSGLPAWIRRACPNEDYSSITIDVGPNEDNMRYISQVREVLENFNIPLEKLTTNNSLADISVSREGDINTTIRNQDSFIEEVCIYPFLIYFKALL